MTFHAALTRLFTSAQTSRRFAVRTGRRSFSTTTAGLPSISVEGTHHVDCDSKPAYRARFKSVLSFHAPENLAAVQDLQNQAFHIDVMGNAAYDHRFQSTYGFYEGLAAVCDDQKQWYHVSDKGTPIYPEMYAWCGNFSRLPVDAPGARAMAPVRTFDNVYFHISESGKTLGGPYLYCGDHYHGQSVVWDLTTGKCSIINSDRSPWGAKAFQDHTILDARLPHKGLAAVKDDKGWFFVNSLGLQVGRGRYLEVEHHYNKQARVKLNSGEWAIVDEDGEVILNLGQSLASSKHELVSMSQQYWSSIALRMIEETQVLSSLDTFQSKSAMVKIAMIEPKLKDILLDVSMDFGLCFSGHGGLELTQKGHLLRGMQMDHGATRDKVKYWLQDRYLKTWLSNLQAPAFPPSAPSQLDIFRDISTDHEAVALSQRVLNSYALDWEGIAPFLPIEDLLLSRGNTAAPLVVVDIAGGTGSLLREVAKSVPSSRKISLTCIERPEVVALANSSAKHPAISFTPGDLFTGLLPRADVYLLSRVLHDWDDSRAELILRRIHHYSGPDALLCIIDRHVTPENRHSLLSLHMYQLQKSHERTPAQWLQLFDRTSWVLAVQTNFNGHEVVTLRKSMKDRSALVKGTPYAREESSSLCEPRKAVVPIAGLGTRMRPISTVFPKALLPIVTQNGGATKVQFALTRLLEQLFALDTTIDEVCLVVAPNQQLVVEQYLKSLGSVGNDEGSSSVVRDAFLGGKISVVLQEAPLGFGDAVLCAQHFVGEDPFLVSVGDHLYSPGCMQQITAAYRNLLVGMDESERGGVGLTGACICVKEEIPSTGLLQMATKAREGVPSAVVDMTEKPKAGAFEKYEILASSGGEQTQYLSQLGADILPHSIFSVLAKQKQLQSRQGGELCLRSAMKDGLMAEGKLQAVLVDGSRSDIGTPERYMGAFQAMANARSTDASCGRELKSATIQDPNFQGTSTGAESVPESLLNWLRSAGVPHAPGCTGDTHVASSPGRVDLMGGFADYSGSRVLQHSTALRCYAMVTLTDAHRSLKLTSVQVPSAADALKSHTSQAPQVTTVRHATLPLEILSNGSHLVSKSQLGAALGSLMTSKDELWKNYIVGAVHAALEQHSVWEKRRVGEARSGLLESKLPTGVCVTVVSDVPWNAGLASSAAVEMAVVVAMGHALKLPAEALDPIRISSMCQEVENQVVGANCGLMDHLAVAHAQDAEKGNSSLLGFDCRLPKLAGDIETIALPKGMSVLAVESGVERSVADPPYAQVRAASLMGFAMINDAIRKGAGDRTTPIDCLSDIPPSVFCAEYQRFLPDQIAGADFVAGMRDTLKGLTTVDPSFLYRVRAATAHPIEEHARVLMFEAALRGLHGQHSEVARGRTHHVLGELMRQSHASYSMCGLGTSETDLLVSMLHDTPVCTSAKVIGAKISGGGGGGALSVVVWDALKSTDSLDEQAEFWKSVQAKYHLQTGLTCKVRGGTSGKATYHGRATREVAD